MQEPEAFDHQPTNRSRRRWCRNCAARELAARTGESGVLSDNSCDVCGSHGVELVRDGVGTLLGQLCRRCVAALERFPDAASAEWAYRESIRHERVAVSSKDRSWLLQAVEASRRFSTCAKAAYYALIVDSAGYQVSQGWNGVPAGWTHCLDGGCQRAVSDSQAGSAYTNCVAQHAELGAILRAPDERRRGSTLFVNGPPCLDCSKVIVHAGIRRVVFTADPAYSSAEREALWMPSMVRWLEVDPDELESAGADLHAVTGAGHAPEVLRFAQLYREAELVRGMAR